MLLLTTLTIGTSALARQIRNRYDYDVLGRLAALLGLVMHGVKAISMQAAITTLHYYDDQNVLAEFDGGSGNLNRYYVNGPTYVDERVLVYDVATAAEYYYLLKELYTVAGLADAGGQIVELYDYDAYGTVRVHQPLAPQADGDYDDDGDVDLVDFIAFQVCFVGGGTGCDVFDFDDDQQNEDIDDYLTFVLLFGGPEVGAPYATQIVSRSDLNAYFFTGRRFDQLAAGGAAMYHYRRRAYDPVHARFLQRDPAGYVDGMNLYEYVGGSPVVYVDPWGLWKIKREGSAKATAEAEEKDGKKDTIKSLADAIGLNESEFKKWLGLPTGKIRTATGVKTLSNLKTKDVCCPGQTVEIPNTVLAYWAGEVGGFGKFWVMWDTDVGTLKKRGFSVPVKEGWTAKQLEQYIQNTSKAKELHGIFFWGHGLGYDVVVQPAPEWDLLELFEQTQRIYIGVLTDSSKKGDPQYQSSYGSWNPEYGLGVGILFACGTQAAKSYPIFSSHAKFWGCPNVLVPHGLHLFGPAIDSVIPKGAQGTQ